MVIETCIVPIRKGAGSDGASLPKQLLEALEDFAKSRASRDLVRKAEKRGVLCDLRVPLLKDCPVRSDELGRALRTVLRAAIETSESGDHVKVAFRAGAESGLVIEAVRDP